jgi:hypothetical protein
MSGINLMEQVLLITNAEEVNMIFIRRVFMFLLVYIILSINFIYAQSNENLIPNGSFEIDEDKNNIPDGWLCSPYELLDKTLIYSEDAHSGGKSVSIRFSGETTGERPWYIWQTFVDVEPLTTYDFCFWIKAKLEESSSTKKGVEIKIIERDDKGEWIKIKTESGNIVPKVFIKPIVSTTNGWEKISFRFTTTETGRKLQIIFQLLNIKGQVWLDNLSLIKSQKYNPTLLEKRLDGGWITKVAFDIITPHIKWARPYVKGPIKIFSIISNPGKREIVELFQRLDSEIEVVISYAPSYIGVADSLAEWEGSSWTEKLQELKEKLKKDYDVYLIGTFKWETLPVEIRYEILEKVSKGKGIIFVTEQPILTYELNLLLNHKIDSEREKIIDGIPLKKLKFGNCDESGVYQENKKSIEEIIIPCEIAKGRAIFINYPYPKRFWYEENIGQPYGIYNGVSLTPYIYYSPENLFHYEYYHQLLIKSILWVSKKLFDYNLKLSDRIFNAGEIVDLDLKIETFEEKASLKGKIWYRILSEVGRVISSGEIPVRSKMVNIYKGYFPKGCYFIELILFSYENKVLSFITDTISVEGNVNIDNLMLEREKLNANQLVGSIAFSGQDFSKIEVKLEDIKDYYNKKVP